MAIIQEGRILLEAEPLRAAEELMGASGDASLLPANSRRWSGGHLNPPARRLEHCPRVCRGEPGRDFEALEPDLKDVYFSVMTGRHGGRVGCPGLTTVPGWAGCAGRIESQPTVTIGAGAI
jgi:hypothetical protein